MTYHNYSVYDFITDESFKKGVKDPESEEGLYWKEIFSENRDLRGKINEARQIILLINSETHFLSKKDINNLWEELNQRIEEKEQKDVLKLLPLLKRSNNSSFPWYRVAAVFIGLLILSALLIIGPYNNTTKYVTQYKETKTFLLPDSSKVVLNANSILKFKSDWNNGETREVWLKGEAFFSVVHSNHQKFIVNTSDLDVKVLGTEFNVRNRKRGTKVVLNSGKIQLSLSAPRKIGRTTKKTKEIFMKPGELVEYSEESDAITILEVDTDQYIAWKDNLLVFEDTPLSEIIGTLEESYGYEIILEEGSLSNRKFTATYPADNIDILLRALSKSFNIKISKRENKIIFENNKP